MLAKATNLLGLAQRAARQEPIQNFFLSGIPPLGQVRSECAILGHLNGVLGVSGRGSVDRFRLSIPEIQRAIRAANPGQSNDPAKDIHYVTPELQRRGLPIKEKSLKGGKTILSVTRALFHSGSFAVLSIAHAFALLPYPLPTEDHFALEVDSLEGGRLTPLSIIEYMQLIRTAHEAFGGLTFADGLKVFRCKN